MTNFGCSYMFDYLIARDRCFSIVLMPTLIYYATRGHFFFYICSFYANFMNFGSSLGFLTGIFYLNTPRYLIKRFSSSSEWSGDISWLSTLELHLHFIIEGVLKHSLWYLFGLPFFVCLFFLLLGFKSWVWF